MKSSYMTTAEALQLFRHMRYWNSLAVQVATITGARIGEVLALRRTDIVPQGILFFCRKQHKNRLVKVCDVQLLKELMDNASHKPPFWCFPSSRSKSGHRTREAVWKDMTETCERLGLPHLTPHSARKHYASQMSIDGHSTEEIQKELQHEKEAVTLIYSDAWKERFKGEQIGELVQEVRRLCKLINKAIGTERILNDVIR